MRLGLPGMLILGLALAACSRVSAEPPSPDSIATQVAATLNALPPVAHTSTEGAPGEAPTEPAPTEPAPSAPAGPAVVRVAYISSGNVWLVEGDSPPVQLTSSGSAESVRISYDGERIVFTRRPSLDGPVEIRVVHRDGSGESVLAPSTTWNDLYPHPSLLFNDLNRMAFIPGTHRMLLNTRGIPEGPGSLKYDDVLMLDADAGALTTLLAPESGGDFLIAPDGRVAALTSPDSISLITTEGVVLRSDAITFTPIITYSEYQYYPIGQWAPDSSAIGFAIPSSDPLAADASATLWRLPADGGPAASMALIPGGFFFTQFDAPSLSPSLEYVAFQRDTTAPNIRNLIVARSDGSNETLVATGRLFWNGWSPDSGQFAFGLDEPTNLQLGRQGSAPAAIGIGTEFRWANETAFVYLSGSTGAWTLMRGSIGGPSVALASPAGEFIAFDLTYH
jgi:hypothetical protein